MINLHTVSRKIRSVESTKKITYTMQMVASSKVRRAKRHVTEATPYAMAMAEMLGNLALLGEHDAELVTPHDEIRSVCLVAIVSDRGLAGGFNHHVLRRTEQLYHEHRSQGREVRLIVCGKTAISYFQYREIKPIMAFRDLSADPRVEEADAIAGYLVEKYTAGEIDQATILYNHPLNQLTQVLKETQLLPVVLSDFVDPESMPNLGGGLVDVDVDMDADEAETWKGAITYEPGPHTVMDQLLPEYLSGSIFYSLIDSAYSEQLARSLAMRSATDNAQEMLESLQRIYNQARQGSITTELTEIVGGAAALDDASGV